MEPVTYAGRQNTGIAEYILSQQPTVQHYETFYGEPAPPLLSATVEELAIHFQRIENTASHYGVLLNRDHFKYPVSDEELVKAALKKREFKYSPDDYLPRSCKIIDSFVSVCAWTDYESEFEIREYFGMYYIAVNKKVAGLWRDDTGNLDPSGINLCFSNLSNDIDKCFFIRSDNLEYVKGLFEELKSQECEDRQ